MDQAEYFHSWCRQDEMMLNLLEKCPTQQIQRLPLPIRRLEKKQEIQKMLEARREDYHKAMEGVAREWEKLQEKEAEIRVGLEKYKKSIVKNDKKQERAFRDAAKARSMCIQYDLQLKALQEQCEELDKKRAKTKAQVQKYEKCHRYLEKVVKASEKFQSIPELMSQFHALVSYLPQEEQEEQKSQESRSQRIHCMEEKSDSIVQFSNEIHRLYIRLEKAKKKRREWELRWNQMLKTATRKNLLLGTIKAAVRDIFQTVISQGLGSNSVGEDDIVEQLEIIRKDIEDLTDIWEKLSLNEELMEPIHAPLLPTDKTLGHPPSQ
ncbi:coiled-coil domain-containing protein 42-like 1 [Xenopus laevis]|uniref:Coiled-coil domain-containing protein 42-like 1 n=2 Tax=Xenopus laevis TaxID=8355 RepID=A0A1L8EYX7_XENLA|nr:coiled-coil domain-containing protein 42-like 1 [Xenopus laevis]OCT64541.1 hypothetical protein XELAEV_18045640mg [Xenopus laevis]